MQNYNLKALDGIRGLAAFYVSVHHARLMLTQPFQTGLSLHPDQYSFVDKLMVYFFGFFKFGHEAVIVFFVLSGFVIHLKQADPQFQFKNFSIGKYLKKRIIRIYPTLLVSFLLCIIIDYLIYMFVLNDESIFSGYSLARFTYNFFLIPEAPIWGYNYPIWSLKHEWFFYLLYPLLLWLAQKNTFLPIILVVLLFTSYCLGYKIPFIGSAAYTFLIWNIGALLAIAYKKNKPAFSKYVPILVVSIVVYPFISHIEKNYPILDLTFGCVTAGFLAMVIIEKAPYLNKILIGLTWLGTFSYSLYLLHFPLLNLFKAIVLTKQNQLPYHLWYVAMASIFIVPIIYFIYHYTERATIRYKQTIRA